MRHIGDVIKAQPSIRTATDPESTSTAPENVNCPICRDAGWLRVDAQPGQPNFGRLFPCECLVKQREERLTDELWQLSNLEALSGLTFETYDPGVTGVSEAYNEALRYARNPHGWLFLHGNYGVGKTHLAVAVAKHAMERNQLSVYFRVVPDLLDQLRATFDPDHGVAYDDRFTQIRNCQLLVLDDLGTENTTPWAREKLYQLINHRYNEQLPTVITSNQDFRQIDGRVLSRLLDTRLTRYVYVDAGDYRLNRVDGRQPEPRTPRGS